MEVKRYLGVMLKNKQRKQNKTNRTIGYTKTKANEKLHLFVKPRYIVIGKQRLF